MELYFKTIFFLHSFVFAWEWDTHPPQTCVAVRGQLVNDRPFLLPYRLQGSSIRLGSKQPYLLTCHQPTDIFHILHPGWENEDRNTSLSQVVASLGVLLNYDQLAKKPTWWYTPVIPAHERLKQEVVCKFQASLSYTVGSMPALAAG